MNASLYCVQVYLKLQSRCLLFPNESQRHDRATPDQLAETTSSSEVEQEEEEEEESDDDGVWSKMETVGGGRKRVKS